MDSRQNGTIKKLLDTVAHLSTEKLTILILAGALIGFLWLNHELSKVYVGQQIKAWTDVADTLRRECRRCFVQCEQAGRSRLQRCRTAGVAFDRDRRRSK